MAGRKSGKPEINRNTLLRAASIEFATRGLQGARLEMIAAEAGITRAMVYYYFGGREGLYLAALESSYRDIRAAEEALDVAHLHPLEAMRELTRFRIDYYVRHPYFVALVTVENQNEAVHLTRSEEIIPRSAASLEALRGTLERGQTLGLFRRDVDVVELHQVMVSLGMFNVSNRHTFGAVFSRDLAAPDRVARTRDLAVEVVLRFLDKHSTGCSDATGGQQVQPEDVS